MFEYLSYWELKSEEHKRHYISEIASLVIELPSNCLLYTSTIYAAIDTYLFLCHDINIMRITTPVILGLVIAIILCGLLHKFFYKWLTKNPINFSFGEPSTPIVKSENIIESMDATETQPIKQPMDLPEQESSPSQQSNQDTVNSDCPQDSHLNKYDSILVELKKKEIERQVEIMDAIREYVTVNTAPYLSKEDIATLIANIEYMAYDQPESYKPIRSNIDNPLRSPGLRHLAWNVGERLGVPLAKRAVFIKESFPYELVNATLEYLKLNLRDNVSSQIPVSYTHLDVYKRQTTYHQEAIHSRFLHSINDSQIYFDGFVIYIRIIPSRIECTDNGIRSFANFAYFIERRDIRFLYFQMFVLYLYFFGMTNYSCHFKATIQCLI